MSKKKKSSQKETQLTRRVEKSKYNYILTL